MSDDYYSESRTTNLVFWATGQMAKGMLYAAVFVIGASTTVPMPLFTTYAARDGGGAGVVSRRQQERAGREGPRRGCRQGQGREEGRPALERRIRRHQGREGPGQVQVMSRARPDQAARHRASP